MSKDSASLVVDRDDLEKKVWSCAKYKSLQTYRSSEFCLYVCDSSLKFRIHLRKHHRNPHFPSTFSCPVTDCKESSKKYTRFQYLQNHYDCVHRESRDYCCHVCRKTFSSQKTCTRHVKNCTAGTLSCKYCSKSFTGYTTLSRHCRTLHLEEINKEKESDQISECQSDLKDSSVKYLLVPLQNVVVQTSENNMGCPGSLEPIPNPSQYTTQHSTKRLKQGPVQQANICLQTSSQWHSEFQDPTKDCRGPWSGHEPSHSFSTEFGDRLRDKELFSALDNIHGHTQTEGYQWDFNEFSTQTASPTGTERSSFGTQTRCPNNDLLETLMGSEHCDLVEFLDSEVQTETLNQASNSSSSFASQTNLSAEIESLTNDRGCGIDRSDRDCQTYFYKNSTHTQTKLRKERSLIVVDGLNTETQTPSLDQMYYNESFTQTLDNW